MNNLLTVRDVSKLLGITESRVYSLSYRGVIPCSRLFNRRLFFKREDIESLMQSNSVVTKDKAEVISGGDFSMSRGRVNQQPLSQLRRDPLDDWVDKIVNQAKMEVLYGSLNDSTSSETKTKTSNNQENNTKDTGTEDKWTTIYSSISRVESPANVHRNWQVWKPKEGDVIKGKVIEINRIALYTRIQTFDNHNYTVISNKVLFQYFDKEGIHEGDAVTIKFLGLFQIGMARFKNYAVTKDNQPCNAQDDLIEQVRNLRAQGKSYRQIATATGASVSKVRRILIGNRVRSTMSSESIISTPSQTEQQGHNSKSSTFKPDSRTLRQTQNQSWFVRTVGKIIQKIKIKGIRYGAL